MAYIIALQLDTSIWNCVCQRLLEGIVRRSAAEKRPKRKAVPLPGEAIAEMIMKYILAPESESNIPFIEARTILCLILQYHTLSRAHDIRKLRACDLQCVKLKDQEAIKITYRSAKNDVQYESCDAFIVEEQGSDLCPVKESYELNLQRFFVKYHYGIKSCSLDAQFNINYLVRVQ